MLLVIILGIVIIFAILGKIRERLHCREFFFKHDPRSIVIAVDLHGTLVHQEFIPVIKLLYKEIPKVNYKLLFEYHFWSVLWNLLRKKKFTEFDFNQLLKNKPILKPIKYVFVHILAAQRLDASMVHTLHKLKNAGYRLYLCSNVWPDALKELRHRYKTLDNLFIDYYIPNPHEDVAKPQKKFFIDFKHYIERKEHISTIILIDDSERNLEGAYKAGIQSCDYQTLLNIEK